MNEHEEQQLVRRLGQNVADPTQIQVGSAVFVACEVVADLGHGELLVQGQHRRPGGKKWTNERVVVQRIDVRPREEETP